MVYVDVMLAWNPSAHRPFGTISLFEVKRLVIYHAEHHRAKRPTVVDMCLLACRLDLKTIVIALSVGCDLGRIQIFAAEAMRIGREDPI